MGFAAGGYITVLARVTGRHDQHVVGQVFRDRVRRLLWHDETPSEQRNVLVVPRVPCKTLSFLMEESSFSIEESSNNHHILLKNHHFDIKLTVGNGRPVANTSDLVPAIIVRSINRRHVYTK